MSARKICRSDLNPCIWERSQNMCDSDFEKPEGKYKVLFKFQKCFHIVCFFAHSVKKSIVHQASRNKHSLTLPVSCLHSSEIKFAKIGQSIKPNQEL